MTSSILSYACWNMESYVVEAKIPAGSSGYGQVLQKRTGVGMALWKRGLSYPLCAGDGVEVYLES